MERTQEKNVVNAYGISDLKPIIELLINGEKRSIYRNLRNNGDGAACRRT